MSYDVPNLKTAFFCMETDLGSFVADQALHRGFGNDRDSKFGSTENTCEQIQ